MWLRKVLVVLLKLASNSMLQQCSVVCEEEGECKSDEFKYVDGQCVPEDCYCDGEECCEDVRDAVCLGHQFAHMEQHELEM